MGGRLAEREWDAGLRCIEGRPVNAQKEQKRPGRVTEAR